MSDITLICDVLIITIFSKIWYTHTMKCHMSLPFSFSNFFPTCPPYNFTSIDWLWYPQSPINAACIFMTMSPPTRIQGLYPQRKSVLFLLQQLPTANRSLIRGCSWTAPSRDMSILAGLTFVRCLSYLWSLLSSLSLASDLPEPGGPMTSQ